MKANSGCSPREERRVKGMFIPKRFGCLFLALMVLSVSDFPLFAQSVGGAEKLTPSLRARLKGAADQETFRFSVVLRDQASQRRSLSFADRRRHVRRRQDAVLDALPQWAGRTRRLENVAGFSGMGDASLIQSIARLPEVERVYLDIPLFPLMSEGGPLTGADHAATLGITGSGVNVAILDGGVMTSHPDLAGDVVAEACFCEDTSGLGCCPDGSSTMMGVGSVTDVDGHGTMVSGVITSSGGVASRGIAPDSGIVAVKVYDPSSAGLSISSVDAALDWILSEHVSLGVRVVNLSLGSVSTYSNASAYPCAGTLTAALVSDLAAVGIATFASSGNDGVDDGISFPACISEAISVGGVYDANVGFSAWAGCSDLTTAADLFVCHTNSGPLLDMLAPDWRTRTTALGGGATNFGGTSASSPYAAGLAALLFAQDPSRTPAEVKTLLISGGPSIMNPSSGLSFPRADVSDEFPVCGDGELSGNEECDDGNVDGGDCCSSLCTFDAASTPCDNEDACTTDSLCDGGGSCSVGVAVICDDGLYCTGVESCDSDLGCQPGVAPSIEDGVGCTVGACDEASDVVTHSPDNGACDNGLYCDGVEVCDPVLDCQSGVAPSIEDGVGCTVGACDEVSDVVTHSPDNGACDNGLYCDGVEVCDPVLDCQSGVAPSTEDGVGCTVDTCDEVNDLVMHTADDGACSNGLYCDGLEVCDPMLDCQSGSAVSADDGVPCTIDSCDESAGGVLHVPDDASCDDLDPCTADLCDALLGCQNEVIAGCIAEVPLSDGLSRLLLIALLLLTGGAGLWSRWGRVHVS